MLVSLLALLTKNYTQIPQKNVRKPRMKVEKNGSGHKKKNKKKPKNNIFFCFALTKQYYDDNIFKKLTKSIK